MDLLLTERLANRQDDAGWLKGHYYQISNKFQKKPYSAPVFHDLYSSLYLIINNHLRKHF